MPALLQICLVIVTIAVIAVTVAVLRAAKAIEKISQEVNETAASVRASLDQVRIATDEAHEVMTSVKEIVPHVRAVAIRFEDLGTRAARVSSDLLEEVEAPVRTAVAVARGVRRGTATLFDRLVHRMSRHRASMNGGR
jgi:uncharacterized protein YoxC